MAFDAVVIANTIGGDSLSDLNPSLIFKSPPMMDARKKWDRERQIKLDRDTTEMRSQCSM